MCPICAQSGACAAASYPPDSQKRAVELPIPPDADDPYAAYQVPDDLMW
ncbi:MULTISPECIES: DUF2058 family protein [unclassified Tepidimonas]